MRASAHDQLRRCSELQICAARLETDRTEERKHAICGSGQGATNAPHSERVYAVKRPSHLSNRAFRSRISLPVTTEQQRQPVSGERARAKEGRALESRGLPASVFTSLRRTGRMRKSSP